MSKVLTNKKGVIVGGGRGIGKAIAQAFLKNGAELLLVARSDHELKETQRELSSSGKVEIMRADISKETDILEISQKVKELWGNLDILVNAAAISGPIGPLIRASTDEWRKTIDINLVGTFLAIKALAPLMRQARGKIINFVGGGDGAYPNFTAYVASKGGIGRLTETVAAELKDSNIDVNAIAPGPVNTKMLDDLLKAGAGKAGAKNYERALKQKAEGGVSPEKAAALALFLASSDSDGLSGKIISAVWDNYGVFSGHLKGIMLSDVYTLRRVKPEHRGMKFD